MQKTAFLRWEQGFAGRASGYLGTWLLGGGHPVPPGSHTCSWGDGDGGSMRDGKHEGEGSSRKADFSSSAPGVDGAGTGRACPRDGTRKATLPVPASLGGRSSPGMVRGMGQAFGGAAPSPQWQSCPAPRWHSPAVSGLFVHMRSRLFLLGRTARWCAVRLDFPLCGFVKAELYLVFKPPGIPVRCLCSSC